MKVQVLVQGSVLVRLTKHENHNFCMNSDS